MILEKISKFVSQDSLFSSVFTIKHLTPVYETEASGSFFYTNYESFILNQTPTPSISF